MNKVDLRPAACLLDDIELINSPRVVFPRVSGIVMDSREIQNRSLFVAVPGTRTDGHDYIDEAVQRGAAAVVGSRPAELYRTLKVPYLQVQDARTALAHLAAAWYEYPARNLMVIGVTGTDGKTTTANLIFQILRAAGIPVGMISTVNAVIGDEVLDTGFHVTTPEALDIQGYLSRMVEGGLTHAVLEATSHGLAQKRVASCEFDIGVVTNITHEHLDFHGSYHSYFDAKASLFELVADRKHKRFSSPQLAVINQDDGSYPELAAKIEQLRITKVSYGLSRKADFQALNLQQTEKGISFRIQGPAGDGDFFLPLLGAYNVYNSLAAVSACLQGAEVSWQQAAAGISSVKKIPGRMEVIDLGQKFTVIVDFAHTPNALKESLQAARKMTTGRVIAVFGSAGLRDREKRRMMAEISGELADLTVLTAEDPRTESLVDILEEMARGVSSRGGVEGSSFWRIKDRGDAIRQAISLAEPEDLVIICGKGHEQSMCFGETEYPWDDRTAARVALAEYLHISGPQMPDLPTSSQV